MMANVSPANFEGDNLLTMAIVYAILGLLLVLLMDRFSPKES